MNYYNNNYKLNAQVPLFPLLFAAIFILTLIGCSSVSDTDNQEPAESLSFVSADNFLGANNTRGLEATFDYLFGDPPAPPSREELRKIPFPIAYIEADDNPKTIIGMVLNGAYGEIWLSGRQSLQMANGRFIGSGDVNPADLIITTNLSADPLRCFLATSAENWMSACPKTFTRNIDVRPSKLVDAIYQRGDVMIAYAVESTFQQVAGKLIETGAAESPLGVVHAFENEFTIENGRVTLSRQWLNPHVGYIDFDLVTPKSEATQARYDAPSFYFETPSGSRLSLLLENEMIVSRLGINHYWPLLRIHTDELQQQLEARKQGMRTRLLLLREYYRKDGEADLAAAAEELLNAFESWPLRATYQHGIQPPQMLIDFAENPFLNTDDAGQANNYTVTIPTRPTGYRLVGLDTERAFTFPNQVIYDVQPNGSIQAHQVVSELLLPIPGQATIRLYSISDALLPPGFRDLNYQLALFLQHWDWYSDVHQSGGES